MLLFALVGSYEYFAAKKTEEIGASIFARLESIASAVGQGMAARYRHAFLHYYGFDMGFGGTAEVSRDGEEGEIARVRVNKSRANAKSLLGLVLGPKFTWRPQARSGAYGARASILLSTNLLEWYWKRKALSRVVTKWTETAIIAGEAFVLPEWEPLVGNVVGVEPPSPENPDAPPREVREGDVVLHNIMPWNVLRDPERECWEDEDWIAVRRYLSRATTIAKYPADALGKPTESLLSSTLPEAFKLALPDGRAPLKDSDTIPVWYFWHKKTMAVPDGRFTVLVSSGCVLEDGPLQTDGIPLLRLAADELLGTPFAYTSWWDGLGIQELMDGLQTAIATNQTTLAFQSIALEEGTQTQPDRAFGMNYFYYKPGSKPPVPLQLTKSPPEVFEHLQTLAGDQRDGLGLNDVVQGNPDTAQMNAEAFTLLASMAVQRNSPFQQAVVTAVGELGSLVLATLRENMSEERKAVIAGADASLYEEKPYTSETLACIDSVIVDVGNPIEQSVAGKFQLAQMLLKMGALKTVEQLQQVVETGRIEPIVQSERAALLSLQQENEALARGEPQPTHALEDHLLHFRENAAVIHQPGAKGNQQLLLATHQHLSEHYAHYWGMQLMPDGSAPDMTQDPQYFIRSKIMLGQQPPPMAPDAMGPGGPPPPGGAPPEGGPPPDGMPPPGPAEGPASPVPPAVA